MTLFHLFYFLPTTVYPKLRLLETSSALWSPALAFSFPLRDRTFHLCSAFGKTERFSGALRQQLGGHMGPRSRHEGLRVPSDSAPAATAKTRRGANKEKRVGSGPSSRANNGLQSQRISASAVERPVPYTAL